MKRIIGGTAGVLIAQIALWPDHHLFALVVDAVSILALAGAKTDQGTHR